MVSISSFWLGLHLSDISCEITDKQVIVKAKRDYWKVTPFAQSPMLFKSIN